MSNQPKHRIDRTEAWEKLEKAREILGDATSLSRFLTTSTSMTTLGLLSNWIVITNLVCSTMMKRKERKMTDKKFYITIEVSAQMSGETAKDTEENRRKYRHKIMEFVNSMKRKLDYNFYIHSDHVVCIYDEKGREI